MYWKSRDVVVESPREPIFSPVVSRMKQERVYGDQQESVSQSPPPPSNVEQKFASPDE